MAVYTFLTAEKLSELISHYDVGTLISAKGIAEGVSNSNWIIETSDLDDPLHSRRQQFILTMYERRIDLSDLPYFLSLIDHLASKGCPVPRTINDKEGASFRMVDGKAVALIECMPGVSVDQPTTAEAEAVGKALAEMHLAVFDFTKKRPQKMGLDQWREAITYLDKSAIEKIDNSLPHFLSKEIEWLSSNWPAGLPEGAVHCDLFPDNVLMLNRKVSGLIDFYFAANDFFAYDLAVTHAAWSFDIKDNRFRPEIGNALISGYESIRSLEIVERQHMSTLARGACIRFILSRLSDIIELPSLTLLSEKNPMDFFHRHEFYVKAGSSLFGKVS